MSLDVIVLTDTNSLREVEHQFHRVFRDGNALGEPVQPWVPARAVFASSWAFAVHDDQFDALARVAQGLGDEYVYMCSTGWDFGFRRFAENLPRVVAPLREGTNGLLQRSIYEASGWLPNMSVTPAMFSRSGTWGVLTEDEFAIAAGTQEFIDTLRAEIDLDAGLSDFLKFINEVQSNLTDKMWIPRLLRHIYGEKQGAQLLNDAGLSTLAGGSSDQYASDE